MNPRNKYSSIIPILILMILLLGCVKTGEQKVKPYVSIIDESEKPSKETHFSKADRFGFVCMDPLATSDLNLGWVRPHPGPFIWGKIEPERGKHDFSEADKVVKEVQAMA